MTTNISNNHHTLLRKKYGVSKSEMHSLMINAFHIPVDIATVACKQYFTRKWEGCQFLGITEGIIKYNIVDYLVVYHNCTPYQFKRANKTMYSFREAQDEFNIPAYVLIKILTDTEE